MAGGKAPNMGVSPHLIARAPSGVTRRWGVGDGTPGGSSGAGGAVGEGGVREVPKTRGSTPEFGDVTQKSWDGTLQFWGGCCENAGVKQQDFGVQQQNFWA